MSVEVGQRVHGFAGGCFGRDSYTCRTVEHVGPDWVVFRDDDDFLMLTAMKDAEFAVRAYGKLDDRNVKYGEPPCCNSEEKYGL